MASLLNMSGSRLVGSKVLPYDVEIEYLESSGTQFINTEVYGTELLKTELSVQELRIDRSVAVFGCFSSDKRNYYLYQAGASVGVWQVGFRGFQDTNTRISSNRHTFIWDNFSVYIDGIVMETFQQGSFKTPKELLLFNIAGGQYRSVAKRVYYCKMWDNGVLTRDLIPVRVGQVGYMYDKVSKKLFGNNGTGNFILGPDKTN